MKSFLTAIKGFAESIGGLIVVVLIVLWHADVIGFIENFPPNFNWAVFGGWLTIIVLGFAVIWAQAKSKVLLAHGILLYLFVSALSIFVNRLFSNTPSNAFDGEVILNLLVMLYAFAVVLASLLYDRPKAAPLKSLTTLSLLIFFAVSYFANGFTGTLFAFLIVLVALLLGSKVVALAYAISTLLLPVFARVESVIQAFNNNLDQQFNTWFLTAAMIVSLVFLSMDFIKAIQTNEN